MPRRARIAIPHLPHHIVQRGHSRNWVFFSDSERTDYLGTLGECRVTLGIRVYAYCLMDNHVHLVVDPLDDIARLSDLMKRLAGRHTRRLNRTHGWSGSLWESRFKCSPIDTGQYLLACGRYVDQNPVRAHMVATPAEFAWSSYRARAGLLQSPLLDLDPALDALSPREERRWEMYRALVAVALPNSDLDLIRGASTRNQLTGSDLFVDEVRKINGLDVPARGRGRPRKVADVQPTTPQKERAPIGALSRRK
jgi:putative transposase